jgi:hypothetical protein
VSTPVDPPALFQHIPPMTEKFHGTLDELKAKVARLGFAGDWVELPNRVHKLICRDKGGMLWSETKGTIWFDGPGPAKAILEKKVLAALSDGTAPAQAAPGAQIFVVHGRDHDSRDQLELILNRLGLTPFVLEVTGGGGDTLIEALEHQIGKMGKCKFGIVLATPDDLWLFERRRCGGGETTRAPKRHHGNGNVTRIADAEALRDPSQRIR